MTIEEERRLADELWQRSVSKTLGSIEEVLYVLEDIMHELHHTTERLVEAVGVLRAGQLADRGRRLAAEEEDA